MAELGQIVEQLSMHELNGDASQVERARMYLADTLTNLELDNE